jgi:hypothetical protein
LKMTCSASTFSRDGSTIRRHPAAQPVVVPGLDCAAALSGTRRRGRGGE